MVLDHMDSLPMPINQITSLRYAVAVAEQGSFSAAARFFGVGQPTVSAAISDLEETLATRLFVRTTRKVELTPAGTALIAAMRHAISAVAEVERMAISIVRPQFPELRLGFTPLVGASRLGRLMEPYCLMHPEVAIIYQECSTADLEARLDAGLFDVVFGARLGRHRLRGRTAIGSDPLRFLTPPGSDGADGPVAVADAAKYRMLLTADLCGLASATRAFFADEYVQFEEYAGHAMGYLALQDWVDLGLGAAIIPVAHLRAGNHGQQLVNNLGKPLMLAYEGVWRKDFFSSNHGLGFQIFLRRIV